MEPNMKNTNVILAVGAMAAVCGAAEAAVYYSTNFATGYTSGNLVGQNGWTQMGTTTTNPVQVAGGFAVVGTSGQDVYSALTTSASAVSGTSFYLSATIRVTGAQAAGDYFLHVGNPAGNTSNFYGRVHAKSSGTGFVLGVSPSGQAAAYGSAVLSFNQSYNVILALDFVAGTLNDVVSVFVNPASSDRSALTAYATSSAWGTTAEPASIASVNLRQGSSANAPSVSVSSLIAGDSLASVGVPAPGAVALLGVAGLVSTRRRR